MPQSLLTPVGFIEHLEGCLGQPLVYSNVIRQVFDHVMGWNQQNLVDHQIVGFTRNDGGGFCIVDREFDLQQQEKIETHFAVIKPQNASFRLDLYVNHNCQHLYPNYFGSIWIPDC